MVLYVCVTRGEDGTVYADQCRGHAEARDWRVVKELTDQGDDTPSRKPGLQQALELIKSREAGGIITPFRSCISILPSEYEETAAVIAESGGFIKVLAAPHTDYANRRDEL